MKHIKLYKVFELKSSTYLSAADKLDKFHPVRAERLRKWADEQQESDINYIDPRTFYINDDVYYVTDISDQKYNGRGELSDTLLHRIDVTLSSSTTDDKIKINLFNNREVIESDIKDFGTVLDNVDIIRKDEWGDEHERKFYSVTGKEFSLNNRKEARSFIQIIENYLGIKLVLRANEIYKTL